MPPDPDPSGPADLVVRARRAVLPGGTAANERTSIYSATGIAPTSNPLPPGGNGELQQRNSFYSSAGAGTKDGASVRSGLPGHGRADSITGSVGGVNSPLASPMEVSEKDDKEKDEVSPLPTSGGSSSNNLHKES